MSSLRTCYGVSGVEVERFVEENEVVKDWLGRFHDLTRDRYAYKLCRYFKWLKVVKAWDVSPKDLLNEQFNILKDSRDVGLRRKHVRLALEHTRDNPDFKDYADHWKHGLFLAIKSFYDYHTIPLTTARNVFGRHNKVKNHHKQITLEDAKKIISLMPQRERTILLIILQSGTEIHGILGKMNFMWDSIIPQIESGAQRVKVEFNGRKGNNLSYFTYFSRDAIQELKKWLAIRQNIVSEKGEPESHPIFITEDGKAYSENTYYQTIDYYRKHKKVPWFVTHQFRKLFKTEASVPERGIDRKIVEFWMGHVSGIASVGGTYDRTPEIYESVIDEEYVKLEPVVNIYSGSVASKRTDPLLADIEKVIQVEGGRKFFERLLKKIDKETEEWLQKTK